MKQCVGLLGEMMTEETKKVLEIGDAIRKGIQDGLKARRIRMTDEEAKRIILDDPAGNIVKRMEAIAVARYFLGEDCTMEEIWRWAEGNGGNQSKEEH